MAKTKNVNMTVVTSKSTEEIAGIINKFIYDEKAQTRKIVDDGNSMNPFGKTEENKPVIGVLLEGGPVRRWSKPAFRGFGFGTWAVQVLVSEAVTSRFVEFVAIGEKLTLIERLSLNSSGSVLANMRNTSNAERELAGLTLSMYFGEKLMRQIID